MTEELTPSVAADPRLGSTVDKYKILKKLGEGGMGAVYEGEHLLIKRRVAIKCLHAHYAQRPEAVARFHREALAATQIGNEHIIEVTDMGRFPDGAAYLVLEMLDGSDLAGVLERAGTMPISRVVHIVSQLCDALGAAHAKGIVHRDLKPENIFLIRRGGDPDFVKVLDFGISKFAESVEGGFATASGMALGTPYYMAPEQARDSKSADHRVDLYAIGVIVFHLLTGRFPIEADSFPILMMKIVAEAPLKLEDFWPGAPSELSAIVDRCLSKSPEDRFQDCASLKAALEPLRSVKARSVPPPAATPQVDSFAATAEAVADALPKRVTLAVDAETPAPEPPLPATQERPVVAPKAARSLSGPLAAVAAILGLAIAATVIWLVVLPEGDAPESPPLSEAAPPEPPEEVDDPAPARVHVLVVTDPASAELSLQGSPVANPFEGELPRGVPHSLVARAPGYEPEVRELVLDGPEVVRVTLRALPANASAVARPRARPPVEPPRSEPRIEAQPPIEPARVERTPPAEAREPPALVPPTHRPTKQIF